MERCDHDLESTLYTEVKLELVDRELDWLPVKSTTGDMGSPGEVGGSRCLRYMT